LSLTALPNGANSYSWTGPNTFTSNLQNPTIAGATTLATGMYSVTQTVNGCTSPAGTVSVTINGIPGTPTAASNSTLCAGSTLSLTALPNGASSYNWTGPNGFSSAVQNPTIGAVTVAASGTYSVTQTILGCTGPAGTVAVTINPIPATPTASANTPICALTTLSLSALPNGAFSYNWTGPNSFTSNVQNPTINSPTVTASGTYSVTQTVLGCTSPAGTVAVTVNATPAAPTAGGTATLCSGSTVSLTSTNPGGATFSWTGPNGFTSNLQNPTIVGATTLATGMYSVNVTVNGCTGPAGTFSVNVFGIPSPPNLGANSPICTGQTLSLTASFIAGASYLWTGPNSFTSAVQNPTIGNITVAGAGNYSVAVNVSGCGSTATVIAVTVNTTPVAPTATSNSSLCAGSTLSLTANPGGANSYSWTGPNTFTSNLQNPTIAGATTLAAGMYSVTQTINGCTSPAGTVSVTINPIPATPTAASNSTLCAGSTLSLTSGPNGANSYDWTGPNSFTSAVQNPTIGGVTVSASGTYSVTQTVLGCTSPAGIVNVTVNPIPSSPTLTSNSPICALQTLSLNANPGGAISYSWTGPNSFTSAVQNPTIPNTSTLASGTYSATQNVLGCTSPAATIAVVVNPAAPTPTANSNSPICLNQTLSFTQTAIGGATYFWSGPNSFTSAVQNPTIGSATPSNSGTYSLYASVAGCPGQTITVNVLVSLPGTVTPGASPTVCANNSTVVLTGTSSTGSGTWTSSGSGTFSPNTQNGNYLPSNADILAGGVTLTLTSTNNGGCVAVTNTMQVFITPAPTASAGASQTVCANNATIALSGSVTVATGGTWSTSGTGTFVPNNAVLNASYVPSQADITAGTFTLTLTTTGNGNCFAVSNIKVITISPAPVVIPGANPQVVCKNNPNFQLNGSSTTGSGTWQTSGTGTFSPNNNILNPTYIPSTADTTAGSVTLTLTSTNNGGCNPVTATMQLVYVSTLAVNAGSNQTVCGNNATVSLNGVSTTSAGIWTSSGTGTFSPSASSLVTNYIPSPADILSGLVTLTLTTANNGGCNPIHTTMQITITPAPTASAGANQTVCANNATIALNGSVTVATGGSWSSNGTGTFVPNNNNLNTSYVASPADTTAGSVVLTLSTTGNGNCNAVTNTVMVNFSPAPLVTGGNISVCKNNPVAVLNGYSSTGSGTWACSGTGTFAPNNSVLSPTYTPSTADTTAGSVTFTLTSTNNAGCNPVTQTLTITYSGIPTVTAGANQTVCANNPNVVLTGSSSTGSGTWTSNGTGNFSPNSINGVYVPSGADILNGVVILTVTSTNNGGCNAVTNQLTVTIGPSPSVSAGPDYTVCSNTPSINLSGSFSVATGASWSSSGTGTFTPNNINMNVGYIPSSQDTASGNVTIYLSSTGNGNCSQVIDSLLISFIQAPFVNAGPDLNLCPNAANPVLTATSSVGSVTWTTLGSGSFSPNNTTLTTTYVPSGADNSAGSVTLVINTSSVSCGIAADTLVISFKPKPTASFTYSNICFNSVTGFTDASVSMPSGTVTSWYWHFDSDTSTIKNPSYTFTSTGTHTVTLLVSNGNCLDSIQRPVYINPLPSVSFSNVVMCHDSVQFAQTATVSPGGISSYTWSFGDNTNAMVANPLHIYPDSGAYIVNLTLRSDSGCVSSAMDTVHVKKCSDDNTVVIGEPAVPTGFTPNGDGSNDILFVKGGPFNRLDFRVFNEWGNEIFHSTEQTTGWDGKFRGSPQAVGRYIWTVNGELIDGKAFKMAGEVILNR
jgi:gliding motility-associated-like protein